MSKRLIYLISFVLVLSIAGNASAELVGHWRFNEGSGTTAYDSSGHGNHGTLQGDPQWVAGWTGGALEFDGDGDYVDVGSVGISGIDQRTIAGWVKASTTDIPSWTSVFGFAQNGNGDGTYFDIEVDDTGHYGIYIYGWGAIICDVDTRWHHFAATYDGSEGRWYLDGQLIDSLAGDIATVDEVRIGARLSTTNYFPGLIDDVRIYNHALTQEKIQEAMTGISPGSASNPSPANKATEVPPDVTLSWTPGEFAAPTNGHKVYLGQSFNDVNDATGGITQDANSYARPQRLDFGTTYYWRVDEVNAPPTSHVEFKGGVWSFTTELFAYPIDGNNITATASSTDQEGMNPENTINGSGLDDNDLHSMEPADMWLSSDEPNGAWIEYELDKVHKLHEMWVWNSNGMIESLVGFGLKDVTVEYSTNGTDYTTLGTTHEFTRAPGAVDYAHNTTIDFGSAAAKYVKLTANSNWGGIMPQYGLSEVRFFSIPVFAKEPSPDSGTTDVAVDVTLGFRAGREAAEHDVYLSNDEQAVIDGNAPVSTVTETSFGPLSLDLGTTYYWKINEVNEAETPTMWQGEIWNFTTPEYFVVDDFEDYNDYPPNEIWATWVDGYGVPTNGAAVGYPAPDWGAGEHYVETAIVNGGSQAMPFFYSNTGGAAYSEGERTFTVPQNWTKAGMQTLALYFHGNAGNTGQLYVKVNGSKVVYDSDASNLAQAGWQPWNIELASLGTNLQSVTTLAIGIDDNGASGTLYFDDIRLYSYSRQLVTPAEPNNAGLVAHYKLDQDATDSSGNNNHGTLVGDPQWAVGKIGGALEFDGSGDWLDCGNDPILAIEEAVSISAWIKIGAADVDHKVGGNQDDANGGYKMSVVNDKIEFEIRTSANSSVLNRGVAGGIILEVDVWYHVTGVYSLADGYIRTYVNGVLDRELITTEVLGASPGTLYIGCEPYNTDSNNFNGVLDDVRIYNCVLSFGEVAWLAGRTLPFDKPF